MEVPRVGVELELQLTAYTTVIAIPDLSRICHLHLSSRQHQILNPLSPGIKPIPFWIIWFVIPKPLQELTGFFVCLFVCLFVLATPAACRSSQARDWIQAAAATYATVTMDPQPTEPGLGIEHLAFTVTRVAAVGFLTHCTRVGTPFQEFYY